MYIFITLFIDIYTSTSMFLPEKVKVLCSATKVRSGLASTTVLKTPECIAAARVLGKEWAPDTRLSQDHTGGHHGHTAGKGLGFRV